ncbi:MAG: DUF501 domain-containing protein, partial [Acidimicrobiaceae bacterium]|nr:DUF501 domain-containing protein [Acidimicrobiaceae bacterium]
ALAAAHDRYATERDAALPAAWDGPRPTGGVGGTRQGVKCLHAHYAWHLAGGDDPVGRWVADQLAPVAAIDCGTNSVRLLIANPDGETLERLMRITRLGAGVDRTGMLAADAVERTLAVLSEYAGVMRRWGARRARMTATSAARDAANREAFFDQAEAVVGVRPELLSGEEEARLSYAGATAALDPAGGPYLVADIGGGSTELATRKGLTIDAVSLPMGCVRLTERFLLDDPPTRAQLEAAAAYVDDQLDAAAKDHPAFFGAAVLVGLAGTVSAAAAISQGLDHYDRARIHHHVLTAATVAGLLRELAAEPAAARRRRAGMEAERADVIVGGLIVLDRLLHHARLDRCLVSESDILDGLAFTMTPAGGAA